VVEAAPFGLHFYRLEPDGRLVFIGANPAAERILQVSHDLFVGKTIEEAFPALAGSEVPDRYRAVARDGTAWHSEQVTYEGDLVTGAFEVHAFRTAPGEMAAAFQDVSLTRRANAALAREKDRLAVTLRSIGDAVIVTDAGGFITLMNRVAAQVTGWSSAEAEGGPLGQVFRTLSERTGEPEESPVHLALRGADAGLARRAFLLARDGTRRPISHRASRIEDASGAVSGAVLVFRDETEDRARERQLAESEARYRSVVRSIPVVQWATDLDGRFTHSEGLALSVMGLRPGEVVGRTVAEVYADNPAVLADFERALAGEAFASENRLVGRVFESHWGPLRGESGELLGVAGIAQDVTAQRQLQDQVQRGQKLESVGRLAGGVAHDFNNLLTVILGCADELSELVGDDVALREPVEQILEASRRARDVTRQLLAFARREVIAPRPLRLDQVLRAAEPLLRRVLGEDVELALSTPDEPWHVQGDPAQLEQVLLNLTVNARDAMPVGGRVEIALRNARIVRADAGRPDDAPGDWVRLRVEDQGTGMTPEVKAHLFEPFFTTKPHGKGTGLGLATVYGIVTQAGGHIHVESEAGRGTAFEICLPRTTAAVPAPLPRVDAPRPGRERVLVVEDDAQVRALTVRVLEGAGYRVVVASSGAEALALDQRSAAPIELVVTDVVMPGLSGRAVVDRLRERHPGLPALFVSGYSGDVIAQRGVIEAGFHFLPKPFTPAGLLEQIRRVLDGAGERSGGPGSTRPGG
jgi:PAS domain S-box-containing protein